MTTSVGPTEHSDSRLVSSGLSARLSHLVSSRALCVCVCPQMELIEVTEVTEVTGVAVVWT